MDLLTPALMAYPAWSICPNVLPNETQTKRTHDKLTNGQTKIRSSGDRLSNACQTKGLRNRLSSGWYQPPTVASAVARDCRGRGRPAGAATAARGGRPSGRPRRRCRWLRPPLPTVWRRDGVGALPTLPLASGGPHPRRRVLLVDAARVRAWGRPVAAAPTAVAAAASAPSRFTWKRRRARSGCPASQRGGGPRSGAPRAASRTEASRVCAQVRRKRRAAAAAHPWPRRRRPLSGGTAALQAPAPSATPTMGMRGFPSAQKTWNRVRTAWGGVQSLARSSRWSAVHSRGLRGRNWSRAIVRGSRGGRPVVWVRKRWEKDNYAVLVWRDSGVGVGGIVSEQRCLLS